jgi:murein DD-endopeptidase MepM/ murein hydrolase activator NlpD
VQTALSSFKQQEETATAEPQQYIDNFYATLQPLPTQAPDPLYDFERSEARQSERIITGTTQRTIDAELYAEAIIEGDIGGEDIVMRGGADAEELTEDVKTESGLPEVNDFGATTAYSEKFDPAKMTADITVDVLMENTSCFSMPIVGAINSNFGWRHGRLHSGIDLDLDTGDPVYAAIDGEVTTAEYTGGYGNLVVIKHANGLETYYAHLSKIEVKAGDKLLSGDKLGLGGSTGRSTGPHLHFETRYLGAAFDPSLLIDFKTSQLKAESLVLSKNSFKVTSSASKSGTTSGTKKYYTVKKGDTLGKIAARNKTTVSKICKLNGISSKKILKPGQKLRVK